MARDPRTWTLSEVDPRLVDALASEMGIHPVTARCLVGRGLCSKSDAERFLKPRLGELRPPVGLAGLAEALELLSVAVARKWKISVFGDYDVDGVTTVALLCTYLRQTGAEVCPRVAERSSGYGLSVKAVEASHAESCALLIVGDCGTSDVVALERAAELGIETIVIDHHTVPAGDLSRHPASALINPFREDSTFPFRGLASVGLAFYVAAALRSRLRADGHFEERGEPNLLDLLDLVALGTVADLVPLRDENRVLVHSGLIKLAERKRPGLRALLAQVGVSNSQTMDAEVIGWKLAPRLNAPGRMGSAKPALDLLLAQSDHEAKALAIELEAINSERRTAQKNATAEAIELVEAERGGVHASASLVVAGKGWVSGVVGIVASRLVELYGCPTVVIAIDSKTGLARGSGRSVPGHNLYNSLAACSSGLIRFGGHAAAAGLTLEEKDIPGFSRAFEQAVQGAADHSTEVQGADAEMSLPELSDQLAGELRTIGPFGQSNLEPVFLSKDLCIARSRQVGDGSHLKLDFEAGEGRELSAIGFGLAQKEIGVGAVDVLFQIKLGHFQGRDRLELHVQDIRASEQL